MKKIMTIAMLLCAMATTTAFAAEPCNTNCTKTEKCGKKCEKKCDKKCDRPRFNPFEGITLSADQQTRIDALRANRKAACTDSAKRLERRKQGKIAGRPGGNMRADYVKSVKEILTPEQYVVFLENIVLKAPADGHHAKKMNRIGAHKGRPAPAEAAQQ